MIPITPEELAEELEYMKSPDFSVLTHTIYVQELPERVIASLQAAWVKPPAIGSLTAGQFADFFGCEPRDVLDAFDMLKAAALKKKGAS